MIRRITFITLTIALSLLLVTPVAATYSLSSVSYTPNPPLVIGGQQQVTATYYIGPYYGSTTFIKGHELQILQNGRNAAQQSASGSAAFVNGALLSYSTNNDVSLSVTINGVVPQTQSDQVMLLKVEEIDNTGNIVPGSVITISQPLAGQPATPVQTALPTLTPPRVPPAPTKSAGFTAAAGILAISLVFLIMARRVR
jgi:hypothetical protein